MSGAIPVEPAESLFGWVAAAGTVAVLLPASSREVASVLAVELFGDVEFRLRVASDRDVVVLGLRDSLSGRRPVREVRAVQVTEGQGRLL